MRQEVSDHPVGLAGKEKLWVTPAYDWRPLGMLMSNGKEEQGQGQGQEEGERQGVAKKQSWTEFILGAREREFRLHDPRVIKLYCGYLSLTANNCSHAHTGATRASGEYSGV